MTSPLDVENSSVSKAVWGEAISRADIMHSYHKLRHCGQRELVDGGRPCGRGCKIHSSGAEMVEQWLSPAPPCPPTGPIWGMKMQAMWAGRRHALRQGRKHGAVGSPKHMTASTVRNIIEMMRGLVAVGCIICCWWRTGSELILTVPISKHQCIELAHPGHDSSVETVK